MIDNLLVCIGAQKAGTTWLYSVLSQDDQFSYSPFVKEVHYFDYLYKNSPHLNNWRSMQVVNFIKNKEDVKKSVALWLDQKQKNNYIDESDIKKLTLLTDNVDDDWYKKILLSDRQKFALDITPDYAVIGEEGFSHINKIAHNVKPIFILRNPVDRAWSGLLQGKKKKEGDVNAFISELEEGKINIDAVYKQCTTGLNVGQRSNYLSTIIALEKSKLLEKTKIMFYDDLSSNPENFIDEIYLFINRTKPVGNINFDAAIHKKSYETLGKKSMPKELEIRLKDFYSTMYIQLEKYINIPDNWGKIS